MSNKMLNKNLVLGLVLAASCAILFLAIAVQAQYNSYDSDSDSNSDSENRPVMSQAELGKLVRNSARSNAGRNNANLRAYNNQQQQLATATRNLYNKQQPLQFAPTNRRQYGAGDLSGYSPMRASSQANNDDDDGEGASNYGGGANFGANFDSDNDAESQADGQPMNLNQAASGYPNQGDYAGEGFNFGGVSGYGPSAGEAGADFGLGGEGFDGRRAKSASSLMGSRNMGDEDAGAPQFGPNSAVNSGDGDDEGRSGYAPEGNDNDNDDE